MHRRIPWTLAGVALGGTWLWLALHSVAIGPALAATSEAQPGWIVATVACGLGFMLTKAQRWRPLVDRVAKVPAGLAHRAVWVGGALNLLLVHAGDVLRAAIVARGTGAPPAAVLATIAVERVFDFGALALLCAAALLFDPRVGPTLGMAAIAGIAVVAIGVLAARRLGGQDRAPSTPRSGDATAAAPGPAPAAPARAREWLRAQRERARTGLQGLADPGLALRTGLLSLLQWAWIVGAIWSSGAAVGSPPALAGALAVFALMIVGLTLPSAPAQLGTTQLAYVAGFALVGLPGSQALAASLVYTGCVVLPQLIAGGVLALVSGTRIGLTSPPVPDP